MWFSFEPSILVTRPPRTVTTSVQASGQSSGHAVVTVDSGGATAGLGMAALWDRRNENDISRLFAHQRPRSRSVGPGRFEASNIHSFRIKEMAALPQVIIIGGGFAGLAAAKRLRNVACEVTIVDRHNHHVFQPLLYQVATAGLSPGDIASPIRWILRKQPRVRVLLANVEGIDSATKHIQIDGGERLRYDYLIVAAGVTHSYFGHDEWSANAPGLKTLDDALTIRRRLLLAFEEAEREPNPVYQRRLLTFVLIGGGPTGVELAGALGEIAGHALRSEF